VTVFGLTIPLWYMVTVGCAVFASALVLVLAIAARHRTDEAPGRDDDGYEPQHADPSEVDTDYGVGVDDQADREFMTVLHGPPDAPREVDGRSEQMKAEAYEVDSQFVDLIKSFDWWEVDWRNTWWKFDRVLLPQLIQDFEAAVDEQAEMRGAGWAELIHAADADVRRKWQTFDAVQEKTAEHPMLELIGAR